MLLQPSPLHL